MWIIVTDISVGFRDPSFSFTEGAPDTAVTITVAANVVQPVDFFNPTVFKDYFILVYSQDGTAVGEVI